MSDHDRKRKIPVTDREFIWVQDDDKGEVILHVGPTMVSPTAADRVVVDDGKGGFTESRTNTPQRMIMLSDNQYAVVFNPLKEQTAGCPNGKCRPGRNESQPLENGTRRMIPGPCSFYLRPGQRCEVRDAHELASNQYLVVKVYGPVDADAPYFNITLRSAAITTFTAEPLEGATRPDGDPLAAADTSRLIRGRLIVIRGLDTQFYIPPTGVDIVPDTSVDDTGLSLNADFAQQLLQAAPGPEPAAGPTNAVAQLAEEAADFDDFEDCDAEEAEMQQVQSKAPARKSKRGNRGRARDEAVEQRARIRQRAQRAPSAPPPPPVDARQTFLQRMASSSVLRRAVEAEARKSRLVREAVVLGEKEYCVVIDADGKRNVRVGPARVFPGPYDTFMTRGSRNRIYNAYELLPTRALWLRVISPIAWEAMAKRLPRGVELEKREYLPGDEILLGGVSAFFFPFNEIEVLSPETGADVVGNAHGDVFVEAIGIDQKSGIYVRDLSTGEAQLVKGKRSYMVHPGKAVHITRTVPAEDWNHWVAVGEPHKTVTRPVTTPWALSIVVPHNNAVLATSAVGHRVIEGPCVELLAYEETLTYLTLSMQTPKTDDHVIRTCFLRTVGNRVSDVIRIQSSDFVEMDVRVSYHVTFLPEHKDKWFNHENYIQVLVEHLRSLVRNHCRALRLDELWPQIPNLLRDVILGEKVAGEDRAGRLFKENGMSVTEVEVLTAEILDPEIAQLYHGMQREVVSLQIGDRQATAQLASSQLRDRIDNERQKLSLASEQRKSELQGVVRKLHQTSRLAEVDDTLQVEIRQVEGEGAREMARTKADRVRKEEALALEVKLLEERAKAEAEAIRLTDAAAVEGAAARSRIDIELLDSRSKATVAEREAVQQGLVEAMTALGDKMFLSEAAQNMNLVSLFKGKDVGTLLTEVLGGTRVVETLQLMRNTSEGNGGNGGSDSGEN